MLKLSVEACQSNYITLKDAISVLFI